MAFMEQLNRKVIFLVMVILLIACSKDVQPIADGKKTVRITLSTKVGSGGSMKVSEENAIHTLRIYAFDEKDGLIGYHYEPDVPNTPEIYSFSMPLNFSYKEDFPAGTITAKFYVVANEGGVKIVNGENSISFPEAEIDAETGLWKWINESSTITPDALSDLLISGYGTKTESDITSTGLPMSYKDDAVVLTTETNQALKTFEMKRAVVKLHTKFQNDGLETTVNKISFGAFQADKGYLFEQNGSNMIVPNDVTYSSYTTPDNYSLRIGAGIEESVSFYQLPSKVASEVYTFGFNLEDGSNFGMAELKPSTGDLTFIDRNTQLEINVTLNAVEIEFATPAVEPWKSVPDEDGIINVE